jgi:hypothetical protein
MTEAQETEQKHTKSLGSGWHTHTSAFMPLPNISGMPNPKSKVEKHFLPQWDHNKDIDARKYEKLGLITKSFIKKI